MYLLDTNVVSELRKAKTGKANANVVLWAREALHDSMFLSVVTIMEIETGILRIQKRDKEQAAILSRWFTEQVLRNFENKILDVSLEVARACAQMHASNPKSERDALIGATAQVNNLILVTRNIKDFSGSNIAVLNPWTELADTISA